MTSNHTLFNKLSEHFEMNKSRLHVLTGLVLALIRVRDVNLVKLSSYMSSAASQESRYRRLQRFFLYWTLPREEIARLTLSKIPKPSKGYVLSLDRTNWKFGKTHINILTLGIVVGKISMPLVWTTLPQATKRGNSKASQRIALMNKALKVLPVEDIACLTMDREFNGYQWLTWLNENNLTWVLRLRKNTQVNGKCADQYRSTRKAKQCRKVEVFGLQVYFACKNMEKGRTNFLYVISNQLEPLEALKTYKLRWSIEVLFGHLKKKGFNLESTHLREKKKIDKLMAILALAFLFTIGWGLIVKEVLPLNAQLKRKSVFRLALDLLNSLFAQPSQYTQEIKLFDQWLIGDIHPYNFVV